MAAFAQHAIDFGEHDWLAFPYWSEAIAHVGAGEGDADGPKRIGCVDASFGSETISASSYTRHAAAASRCRAAVDAE